MSSPITPARVELAFWALLCGGLATGIGLETQWRPTGLASLPAATAPVSDYSPPTLTEPFRLPPVDSLLETAMRPVFTASRRPVPPREAESTSHMQRGQFLLTGISIRGDAKFAYLREKSTNRNLVVSEGKVLNGISVKQILDDHIELAQGDETESIRLETAKSDAKPNSGGRNRPPRPSAVPAPQPSADFSPNNDR